VSTAAVNTGNRRVLREARTEAVVALALYVALLVGLALVDKAKGWSIVDLPWWAWLLLAAPALVLMTLLLAAPLAELSPGRVRNVGIALLGLLVASDVVAVGVLVVALATSSTDSLSAGDLLAHGTVVWFTNIITFGLLFWLLDEGGPLLRADAAGQTPTSASRTTPCHAPLGARA
jgi:Kef-type K+ transport system membrane component KefB